MLDSVYLFDLLVKWLLSVWKCIQFDIDNFQEKFADLKWAASKRKKMVESSSWPAGAAAETKSFMVSQFVTDVVVIVIVIQFVVLC